MVVCADVSLCAALRLIAAAFCTRLQRYVCGGLDSVEVFLVERLQTREPRCRRGGWVGEYVWMCAVVVINALATGTTG